MSRWREEPAVVRPMLASLDEPPIAQRGLIYEPKYDGIRALVDLSPDPLRVGLYSRNGHDKAAQFPEVTGALAAVARGLRAPLLLDGEIVAVSAGRQPLGFGHIQGRIHLSAAGDITRAAALQPVVIVLFDLLRDGDEDLRGQPLAERRLRLQERIRPKGKTADVVWLSEVMLDDGRPMLERARAEGWEGLIVKDGQSVYQSGRRTPAWRKLKLHGQQDFVVAGWTDPRQSRHHFGALLLGCYEGHSLVYAGSVGTGFDEPELERVAALLAARSRRTPPFAAVPKSLQQSHWVRPDLVARVRFTEWTSDGMLRHPVYLGLRRDKDAKSVTRSEGPKVRGAEGPKVRGAEGPGGRRAEGPKGRGAEGAKGRGAEGPKVRGAEGPKAGGAEGPKGRGAEGPKGRGAEGPKGRGAGAPGGAKSETGPGGPLARLAADLAALEDARKDGDLTLPDGNRLRVTNLAKVFWPALAITKGELLRYYVTVAPFVLPAVADRPLVMKRFPNGIDKPAFYQQRHPEKVPPGVRREVLPADVDPIDPDEGGRERLIGGSLTTLLYMTQLASISQDPWFSRVTDALHQDYTAIDLDPGDGAGFDRVLDVARWVKDELDRYGIPAVPKTSGSRGLHIYIPLAPGTTYDTGQLLCQMIATVISGAHPKVATIERMVKRRALGTVYVDYLQNILGKTLATAYSARASDYAGVSTPLTWEEVASGIDPRDFTIRTAPARFAEKGDLWSRLRTDRPVNLGEVVARGSRPAPAARRRSRGE